MTEDDLKKECRYCYREIDNSGLEGFRCTNKTVIKIKGTTWCLPKCADQPCSTCTYREIKDDNECLFYETCSSRTAICKIRQPDNGCPVYRYFKGLIVKDYEARLKADMVAMLTDSQLEIEEKEQYYQDKFLESKNAVHDAAMGGRMFGCGECKELIQEKINSLKAEREGKE